MSQVLVFGDSEAHGSCDPEGGWVAHLNRYCEQKALERPNYYFPVYNLGISGDTSTYILERFESEAKARISEEKETIFLFQDGGNDAMYLGKEKKNQVPPEKFRANVAKILAAAKKFPGHIAWLEIEPIDEKRLNPIPWHKVGAYLNRHMIEYNQILREGCQLAEVPFIELTAKLPGDFYARYTVDGVHPNSEGHKMIWEIVKKFLVGEKWI